MAFWVVDRGRPAASHALYYVGGKRRVSQSEGGDDLIYTPKRTRFHHDAVFDDTLPYHVYDERPLAKPSGHASVHSSHLHPRSRPHSRPHPHQHQHQHTHLDYGVTHDDQHPNPNTNQGCIIPHDHRPTIINSHHNDISSPYNRSHSAPIDDHLIYSDHIRTPPPPSTSQLSGNLAFLVIRERSQTPTPSEIPNVDRLGPPRTLPPDCCPMERTQSGISISSDTTQQSLTPSTEDHDINLLSDLAAASLVTDHVDTGLGSGRRRHHYRPDSRHARILKTLINPRSRATDFPLDNDALRSIFLAANELFFDDRLTGRVTWDWSHPASAQYQAHIVGTTAVRRSRKSGGYETLIVLSSPILRDTKYNRRLLISTFLHEMIHSYLFIVCGLKARHQGGHTEGFRLIANKIDSWVGRGHLRLGEMDADLEHFRENPCSSHDNRERSHSADAWRESHQSHHNTTHQDCDDWTWHQHEGFLARGPRTAVSSYVY